MKSLLKDNWFAIGLGILIIAVLILLRKAFLLYPSDFINIAWYALVGFTAIYAFASMMVMMATSKQAKETRRMIEEIRQSRLDAVKPALSLQPEGFIFGGGFSGLYLMNSGGVAKDVEIDIEITNPDSKKLMFVPTINREHKVYLQIGGKVYDTGGFIIVHVNFKDGYNQSLSESLSIDFSELKREGREIRGQYPEQYEIQKVLESIERKIK